MSPQLGLSERPREPAGSDTDSADEEVDAEEHNVSTVSTVSASPISSVAKRKATEQRSPEKRARLEPPKTLSPEKRAPEPERRNEGVPTDGMEQLAAVAAAAAEAEVKTEMPSLTREVQAKTEAGAPSSVPPQVEPSSGRDEEMMPQIGPEALVCYEVDLDDLDEKEKPASELLLPTREVKNQPPPSSSSSSSSSSTSSSLSSHLSLGATATAGPQRASTVSSSTSPPTSAASPESHSTKSESDVTIEVDGESQEGLGEAESMHGFDASASSSNSSLSLQERDAKDRGKGFIFTCQVKVTLWSFWSCQLGGYFLLDYSVTYLVSCFVLCCTCLMFDCVRKVVDSLVCHKKSKQISTVSCLAASKTSR